MRSVLALVLIGMIAGCASSAPAPSVAAPEPALEARLYDLGSTELLHAGFGGDARGSGTFFVSLPDGKVLLGQYETIAESDGSGWGSIFNVRTREYSTEEVIDGVLMGVASAHSTDELMVECEYVTSNRVATGHGYCGVASVTWTV